MPKLDLYTLDVVTIANLLATSAVMFLIWTLNKRVSGIRRCATSSLLLCIGFMAIPARMYIPGKAVILFPNLIIFAGALLLLDGIRSFRGFRRETGWFALLAVAFTSCFCYWLFVEDKMNIRVAVGSLFWAAGAFWCAWSMAVEVPPEDRRVYLSTALIFAIEGAGLLVRSVTGASSQPDNLGFLHVRLETINFFTLNLATIGSAFGLSMATILKLQREAERLAFYDVLTNLPNRRMFEERLEEAERRVSDSARNIGLIYCDIDDFKAINDTLGHEGGDKALRVVSEHLSGAVRDGISLARVGGDEFVMLIEDAPSRTEINALVRKLTSTVEGRVEFEGRSVALKISCGVAMYPDDVGSVSDLMRLADAGMYMMKQHGRVPAAVRAAS